MLKKNTLTIALLLAIALLLLWRFGKVGRVTRNPPKTPSTLTTAVTPPAASEPKTQNPKPKTEIISPEVSTLADTLNSASTDIRADVRLVSEIVTTYRTNFPQTGNPTGSNPEITAVLSGQNKLRLALIPPGHPAINRTTGELTDRYGTPFFFHAESAAKMEIRSAGPDKKMWTPDDAVHAP